MIIFSTELQLRWSVGRQPQLLWETVPQLLLHRHLWVRKLAADLLGMGLADPGVCELSLLLN